ncbi:DnaJ domain-containing protein [Patescibacteria group bacterium]|nr:DnaJ domain-containing protein [Patescibacteria group bacterium]MBU0776763.1 DnaJ domain-containing protein [Patescibacteria group bacterium]MBU0846336.1 DnaJ domain-containing protein [Patescibacteria group bacterium]MBU0922704.1 DnaJ domain-containing protein [Patescibacteria group bacterium]MBU1066755.1 DnaJ domain-containing protein [Patescibacteria group bacterium]
MAAKSDYYDILGVSKGASQDEIKKAYRKQALEWHPDKHKDNKETAEKRFKEVNAAYQILSDPEKKQAYDQFGHAAFSPGGMPGGPGRAGSPFGQTGRQGPFTYTYTNTGGSPFSGFDFGDPFEIFSQFFGGGASFGGPRKPRYSVTIDFMEAVEGVEKEVEIEGKKKKIKIPAGIDEGLRINFNDFILSVNVRPHKVFERDGENIFVKLVIPYSLASLGGAVEVATIDGDAKIRIKAGTQSGTMIRLRGKGAPRLRGRGRGDEYVRVIVAVPDKLTREQKKTIEKMRKKGL